MSSLRNAVKRSTHKERAQPAARKHLGLLEKHSDYKKRADDYKKKTARLKTLTRKAAERNQDEFYFAMTKTVAGERRGPAGSASTHAATAKLKAEDLRYVHMRKVVDDRRVDKLRAGSTARRRPRRRRSTALRRRRRRAAPGPRGGASATPRGRGPDKAARVAGKRVRRAYASLDSALDDQRLDGPVQRLEAEPSSRQGPQAQGRGRGARPRRGLQVEEA